MFDLLFVIVLAAAAPQSPPPDPVRVVVAALQRPNDLRVDGTTFRAKANPKGTGTFVYDPKTDFGGTERYLIWIVLDGRAYPLNAPSKQVTPALLWPREAPASTWKATGLNPYLADDALAIVFGRKP